MADGKQEAAPRVQVTFYPPLDLRQEIDRVASDKGRSQWIIEACREKLEREKREP
jgi:metal-responsive CopG/Arc/MetJ family transcriptional regulator